MLSGVAFFLAIMHWIIIGSAYAMQWKTLFTYFFLYPSPVLLFFTLLNSIGVNFSGEVTRFLIASSIFNGIKYFILIRGLFSEGPNFFNISAVIADVIYLALSSAYLVYYSYI